MIFTTSWDDGYEADLRVAQLLSKYGCAGTFYVCPVQQHGRPMLTEDDIRTLSRTMEIGGHSLTHRKLSKLSKEDAIREIRGSKEWVEGVTGKACDMFCYPKGDYSDETAEIVREAGFAGARTVDVFSWDESDPYRAPTTLHIYPFPVHRAFRPWKHVIGPFGPGAVMLGNTDVNTVPPGIPFLEARHRAVRTRRGILGETERERCPAVGTYVMAGDGRGCVPENAGNGKAVLPPVGTQRGTR